MPEIAPITAPKITSFKTVTEKLKLPASSEKIINAKKA